MRRAEETGIVFLDEIDKIAGQGGGPRRPRRLARGRPAGSPPARRGDDGQDEARDGEDGPRPVHRGGSLPRREAVGPDPRAAGPLSDPGRARRAHRRGLPAHPHRARARAPEAVRRAPRGRRDRARLRGRRPRGDRAGRGRGEPEPREHRRPAPAHDPRDRARGDLLRGAGRRGRAHRRRSSRTSSGRSRASSGTATSRASCCRLGETVGRKENSSAMRRLHSQPPRGANLGPGVRCQGSPTAARRAERALDTGRPAIRSTPGRPQQRPTDSRKNLFSSLLLLAVLLPPAAGGSSRPSRRCRCCRPASSPCASRRRARTSS